MIRLDNSVKAGTHTTHDLEIITDDTPRIKIQATGKIEIGLENDPNYNFQKGKVGIGYQSHVSWPGGVLKVQNKKFEVGTELPTTGIYPKGDIIWNSNPTPKRVMLVGYVSQMVHREWKPSSYNRSIK